MERQVREIRADAAAARVLAGAADRDVSEFKQILQGHTRTLNALRETQVEQGNRLTSLEREMREGLSTMNSRIDGVEHEMRQGFSMVNVGMAQITALLRNIEGQGNRPGQS